jgi:Ca-activated chloride channel family protein
VVPDVGASEKIFIPEPEPVTSIGGDFDSLLPPEAPAMDLASVEPPPLPPPPLEIPAKPLPVDRETPDVPALDPFLNVVVDTYHDPAGQGYFRITIRPNEESRQLQALPKDIIFVIDASSSMGRPRFFRLREALKSCIKGLNPADRFTVVGFKREPIVFHDSLIPAREENIQAAVDFVDELEASGRTDIYRSLATTLARRPSPTRPYIVFLFSDGVPTAGRTDAREIIIDLTSQNLGGATIFSFGTAGDPRRLNKYFLDMLSYLNRGFVDFRYNNDEIEPAVESMYRRIDDPLMIDIRGDYGAVSRDRIYPSVLPDLFRDGTINIYGQYSNEEEFYFRLEGKGAGGEMIDFVYRQPLPKEDTAGPEIARQWAFRKIYSVIGEMCLAGESEQGVELVRALSEKYSIETPYYNNGR